MRVKNKVMVVTGGGSGIGRALVLQLVDAGAKVAAVDISEENLLVTWNQAREKKDRISLHVMDVTDYVAVNALPDEVISAQGTVDGLINNAGIIQPFIDVIDLCQPSIDKVMNVNFYGQIYMTKAFLPTLIERPEAHITNISSMGGFFPVAGQTLYGASKAAVKLFTEGLYLELGKTNVKVTVVLPGAIDTNITTNSDVVIKGMTDELKSKFGPVSPNRAAKRIINAIERNRFQVYIGKDSIAMNVLYRINPRFAINFMFKQMKLLLGE